MTFDELALEIGKLTPEQRKRSAVICTSEGLPISVAESIQIVDSEAPEDLRDILSLRHPVIIRGEL